jgi:hypothetical protein
MAQRPFREVVHLAVSALVVGTALTIAIRILADPVAVDRGAAMP